MTPLTWSLGWHRRYSDSKWALPNVDTDQLTVLIERFEVDDPTVRHAWLFDRRGLDWHGYEDSDKQLMNSQMDMV
jgi:hypothetical protein